MVRKVTTPSPIKGGWFRGFTDTPGLLLTPWNRKKNREKRLRGRIKQSKPERDVKAAKGQIWEHSRGELRTTLWWVLIIVGHALGFLYIHRRHANSQERSWKTGFYFQGQRQPWRQMCAGRQFHGKQRRKWCTTFGWVLIMDDHSLGFIYGLVTHADG